MLENWRWSAYRPQTWGGACRRRASPPPVCAAYERATATPVSGLRVRASSRWWPVELRTGRLEQPAGGSRRQQDLGEQWRRRSKRSRPGGRSRVPGVVRTYQGGVEGRHRSFQIPRDGAPLGFRAGRVELDQIGGWCRLVLGFRPQWERVRLVDRPFVVDFRVPLKRDGVPLNDNSHRLSKGHR